MPVELGEERYILTIKTQYHYYKIYFVYFK
jgi:hypothetical protein